MHDIRWKGDRGRVWNGHYAKLEGAEIEARQKLNDLARAQHAKWTKGREQAMGVAVRALAKAEGECDSFMQHVSSFDAKIATFTVTLASTGSNHAYAPSLVRRGAKMGVGMMHTKDHKQWQSDIQTELRDFKKQEWHNGLRALTLDPEGLYALRYHFWLPTLGNDVDGRIKSTQDELFKYLGVPDSRVCDIRVTRHVDTTQPPLKGLIELWGLHGYNDRYGVD